MRRKQIAMFIFLIGIMILSLSINVTTAIGNARDKEYYISDNIILLDELTENPTSYDGHLVSVICYLWPGVEGMGLSSMPRAKRWRYNEVLGRDEFIGNRITAKNTGPYWNFGFSGDSDRVFASGDRLVIVEGYFHKEDADSVGFGYIDTPFIQVIRSVPLVRAGGQISN